MSAQESTNQKPLTEKVETKRTYEGYNDDLELVSKEVPVVYETFTADAPVETVLAKLNEINDYRSAANYLIKRNALSEARKSAGVAGAINREVLMNYIKPYRELPQFSGLIKSEDKRKATADEWNAQTKAICDQIKNVPFIMDAIRAQSAEANKNTEE